MKKGQSAMEYLMTYGWAILIVIIVAAALYALGVFNPATFTGRTATGFTQLGAPSDWDLTTDGENSTFRLKLANNKIPTSVTIHQLSATVSGHTGTNSTEFTISPGETKDTSVLIRNFAPATGSSYSVNV
ncbi:MAG: hypothetical protein J7K72_04445, partial [Candidatus Aenigmarchaeota archaeon]|nr:hypothetical protein [Candidatus Aenigmarchaeota archaeon]